jgi:hypothetical protein
LKCPNENLKREREREEGKKLVIIRREEILWVPSPTLN